MWTSRPLHLWKNKKPFFHRLRKLGHLPTNPQARRLLINFIKNLAEKINKMRFCYSLYIIPFNPFNKILLPERSPFDIPTCFAPLASNQTREYTLMHKTFSSIAKSEKMWAPVAIKALFIKLINNYFNNLYPRVRVLF